MDEKFYVYELIDPFNELPFYIGKGKENRCFSHLKLKDKINKHKQNTINKIRKFGKEPIIKIITNNLSEKEAFFKEKELIELYGRKSDNSGILTNLTAGGEGSNGYKWRIEQKSIKKIQNSGKNNPMYGIHHSQKSKSIMSEKRRNRIWKFNHSEEHKKKLKEYNPGGISSSKPILQINDKNEIIAEWKSLSEAGRSVGRNKSNICSAIKNDWKCNGYKWKYK